MLCQRLQLGACPAPACQRVVSLRVSKITAHASGQADSSSGSASSVMVISKPSEGHTAASVSVIEKSTTTLAAPAFRSPVAHPAFFSSAVAIFVAIALDVFDSNSLHLLQPLDQAAHQAAQSVQGALDPSLRRLLFGNVLSNGWTMAASFGWIFATATALSRNNPLAWKACLMAWALWVFGVGPIEHDPALMEALKSGFGRVRPSTVKLTPSFPSGHAACVALVVGGLLFVLLPVVYGSRLGKAGRGSHGGGAGDAVAEVGSNLNRSGGGGGVGADDEGDEWPISHESQAIFRAIYAVQGSWTLWAASTATTVVGRVGLDAHWVSDTLAGAALGAALVSGLAAATERLAGVSGSSSSSGSSSGSGLGKEAPEAEPVEPRGGDAEAR